MEGTKLAEKQAAIAAGGSDGAKNDGGGGPDYDKPSRGMAWKKEVVASAKLIRDKIGSKVYHDLIKQGFPLPSDKVCVGDLIVSPGIPGRSAL